MEYERRKQWVFTQRVNKKRELGWRTENSISSRRDTLYEHKGFQVSEGLLDHVITLRERIGEAWGKTARKSGY